MAGFNFEKNLLHQENAVKSTLAVFENLPLQSVSEVDKNYTNPSLDYKSYDYEKNIRKIQSNNQITKNSTQKTKNPYNNIIDIMMETGTGKTYTYTKTIFELNKQHGIFKFIIVVPTLSIKAGTVDFLKSDSSREHFKEQYAKTIHLHVVESQKKNKSKKDFIPPSVESFVKAGNFEKNSIQVLLINAGMINSDTMQKSFDKGLFDKYTVPFDAISATKPFMIIDEPHKFGQGNKTWENIQKMKPQFILRYGATFPDKEIEQKNILGKKEKIVVKDYHNLIYQLTAVDAFNNNLVKGIIGHITQFESGKNEVVKFIDSNGTEATFQLNDEKPIKLTKRDNLSIIHSEMSDLGIENLNKSTVVLTNGLEMKKGDKINPYSYASTLQEIMIQKAIKHHFEIEKELLTREVKIKPLTLFFIDNIDEYRSKDGYIRKTAEQYIELEIKELLKTEKDVFYKAYLKKTLLDISTTHAGYFSKDNTEKDEAIEKEINEILHDKQTMLDLENPRRFIFSKWTLREGWDNPNVFQICKLRSSGSEISKLQEVGRGLRLPVNEYGNRVKDEQFYLNYFVDFTENDFVDKLVDEINQKSGAVSVDEVHTNLNDTLIKNLLEQYPEQFLDKEQLLEFFDDKDIIKRNNDFKEGGFDYIKQHYPLIFQGVNNNKIRKSTDSKKKITVRTEKYNELKDLWEKLNEKVILEYKFANEEDFKKRFVDYLLTENNKFEEGGISEMIKKIAIKEEGTAVVEESSESYGIKKTPISTMKYSEFIKELAKRLNINLQTIHQSFIESNTRINEFLHVITIRNIKQNFENYLMAKAFTDFKIEYKRVSNAIHPTKLTEEDGTLKKEISASDVGVISSNEKVAGAYFFDELYYDSELEKQNIKQNIEEVIVFTKIPKNSIKIPVAGGKTYSPDFAYVVKFKNSEQKLHFVVETKNVGDENNLRDEEKFKIMHAEKFFDGKVKIEFRKQFSNDRIVDMIKKLQ